MTPLEHAVFRNKAAVAQAAWNKEQLYARYLDACDAENRLRNELWTAELALAREQAETPASPEVH